MTSHDSSDIPRSADVGEKSLSNPPDDRVPLTPMVIDDETNRRLLRRLDWRLMPILCFTYALQYYDKGVISQAAVFGFRTDLDLTSGLRYSWVSLIFYFGHLAGMYPCSLLAQKYTPRRVCTTLTIVWAIIVLTTPACTSYAGILANRFFLGLVESGVSPVFMMVVGLWYTHEEQVMRSSIWYSFSGGSLLISPIINFGLAHATGALHPWKYMFLFAGGVTLVWGIALIWIFPDTPQEARGFTEEEHRLLLERVRVNNAGAENRQFQFYQVKEALMEYQFWGIMCMSMLATTGSATVTIFASIVFAGMGFDSYTALLLNLPIGVMAFICILGSGYVGTRFKARHYTIAGACLPVVLACCLLWQLPTSNKAGRIVGFYLINFFSSAWVQCIGLGTSNAAGYTKRGAYAAGTWIGYCLGNIMGPLLFSAKFGPRYDESFTGVLVCFAVLFVLSLVQRFALSKKNKRRDQKYGQPDLQNGLEDFTDKENKSFRWHL